MQLWKERVYLAYNSTTLFIIKGSQCRNSNRAGTWKQELTQSPWRSAAYPACFLTEARTCPGMAPPTVGWDFPRQSLIRKIPRRVANSLINFDFWFFDWFLFLFWLWFCFFETESLCVVLTMLELVLFVDQTGKLTSVPWFLTYKMRAILALNNCPRHLVQGFADLLLCSSECWPWVDIAPYVAV